MHFILFFPVSANLKKNNLSVCGIISLDALSLASGSILRLDAQPKLCHVVVWNDLWNGPAQGAWVWSLVVSRMAIELKYRTPHRI